MYIFSSDASIFAAFIYDWYFMFCLLKYSFYLHKNLNKVNINIKHFQTQQKSNKKYAYVTERI